MTPTPPWLHPDLHRVHDLSTRVLRRFLADRCLIGASALSYTTILSLVPLTAIVLVVFSGFSKFGQARERLLQLLIEDFAPDAGKEASLWFTSVAGHAAQSTVIGVVALVVTSIILLATVEEHLNFIFRVTIHRRWGQRVLAYWTVLTLGPILLGVGLSVTGSMDQALWPASSLAKHGAGLENWAGLLLTPLLGWLALSLLYRLIPTRDMPWRACLTGAALAALLLEVLKFGFRIYVSQIASYSAIYGALSGIPIALLWMYIFWAAVLLGAETAACLMELDTGLS